MEKCNRLLDTLAVRAHRENMGEGHSPSSASTRNVVTETNTYRYSVNPPLDGGAPRPKDFIQFETTNRLLGKQARDPGRRPILRVWAPMRPVSCDCGVWLQGLVWLQGPTSQYRPLVYTHYPLPPPSRACFVRSWWNVTVGQPLAKDFPKGTRRGSTRRWTSLRSLLCTGPR